MLASLPKNHCKCHWFNEDKGTQKAFKAIENNHSNFIDKPTCLIAVT